MTIPQYKDLRKTPAHLSEDFHFFSPNLWPDVVQYFQRDVIADAGEIVFLGDYVFSTMGFITIKPPFWGCF